MSLAKEVAAADSAEAAATQSAATASPTSTPAVEPRATAVSPTAQVPDSSTVPTATANSHVIEIVLAPNEGKEIKLVMQKDARVTFSWSTDRGVVNYDTHADAPGISYHGYGKGTGVPSDNGVLVAAFNGAHGWFWRNRGKEVVTVTLRTNGDYTEVKRM